MQRACVIVRALHADMLHLQKCCSLLKLYNRTANTTSVSANARSVSYNPNSTTQMNTAIVSLLLVRDQWLMCCCQVVTVNDYLARRDSEWVGQVHKFLGMQVGLIQQGLSVRHTSHKAAIYIDYQLPASS